MAAWCPACGWEARRSPIPAAASAAAAAANEPGAVRKRQVAALEGIDPERSMKLEATSLALDNARHEQVKKLKDEGVFDTVQAARRGDPQAVFDSFNKNGKFTLQEVPTVTPETRDIPGIGKVQTFTYTGTMVAPDGTVTPFKKNSHDLSLELMPYEKVMDLQQKGTKEAREARKTDAEVTEAEAKAGYYKSASGEKDAKANRGADGKPFKLDEDDKLRLNNANTRVRDAEKAVTESLGKLMPGDDPTKSPAVAHAQGLLRAAKIDHMRTNIELGQITPAAMVNQIMGVAKNPQDVLKSLQELATVGGSDFADQVAAGVQATDGWKQMNPPKPPPKQAAAAAGMPAAAPGAAPAAAPATPAGPADALGQRVDQAREIVRRLQASAPGLAKGRQALDEHAAAVAAAREELQAAEAAYQRSMAGQAQTKAYFGGGRAVPAAAAGMTAGR
jgi:hypothetical protein